MVGFVGQEQHRHASRMPKCQCQRPRPICWVFRCRSKCASMRLRESIVGCTHMHESDSPRREEKRRVACGSHSVQCSLQHNENWRKSLWRWIHSVRVHRRSPLFPWWWKKAWRGEAEARTAKTPRPEKKKKEKRETRVTSAKAKGV